MNSNELVCDITTNKIKRKSQPELYQRNIIKKAKITGDAHINHNGRAIDILQSGEPCSCRNKCFVKHGVDNIKYIFDYFHNIDNFPNKDMQDVYLSGLIDVVPIKRRRKSSKEKFQNEEENIKKQTSFLYNILVGTSRVEVCFKAFLSVFNISSKRVRRIRDLKVEGKPVKDKRGLHVSNITSPDDRMKMHTHIESFPVKRSHYAEKEMVFLDSELNVTVMHRLFKEKYPSAKVSYTTYWSYFKDNFNLRFGQPLVDSCCTCEQLKNKIKSPHLNDVAKRVAVGELMVHKRKSKKFYSALTQETADSEAKINNNVLAIAVDFMQNVCLPKIPVQQLFYLRQLNVNIFCIHNIKANKSVIYVYHEGQAKKGPDEVCSFLNHYINNMVDLSYTELHLYADNCPGQNKNHCVSKFLMALTDSKRFHKIEQFFPVRGHSYLPCDRDFSIIKRALRRRDRLYTVDQLSDLIVNSSKSEKFTVMQINDSNIFLDFKSWWPKWYKKTTVSAETIHKHRNEKVFFEISSFFQFKFDQDSPGVCKTLRCIQGVVEHTFFMAKTPRNRVRLPENNLYNGGVVVKKSKLDDIKKCMEYIPDEYKTYYENIISASLAVGDDDGDD